MTAETYLLYVGPVALLGLGFAAYLISDAFGRRDAAKLQPVRIRRTDRRR